jgi:hypothetical protein
MGRGYDYTWKAVYCDYTSATVDIQLEYSRDM